MKYKILIALTYLSIFFYVESLRDKKILFKEKSKNEELIGTSNPLKSNKKDNVVKTESYPSWHENLIKKYASEYSKDYEVEIIPLGRYVESFHGKKRKVAKVEIRTKYNNGKVVSFKAKVDIKSGKILTTWDRPTSDLLPKVQLKPTGFHKSNS